MPCSTLKLPDGSTAIVKHGKPRRRCCAFCSSTWHGLLCDFSVGEGKTCDKPLCASHAVEVVPGIHYCHDHPLPDRTGGVTFAWFHRCPREGVHFVGRGEPCNWCGAVQANEPAAPPDEIDQYLKRAFGHAE